MKACVVAQAKYAAERRALQGDSGGGGMIGGGRRSEDANSLALKRIQRLA